MLYALATPGSAFKPSLKKVPNTWRLEKFKSMYYEKGGSYSPRSLTISTSLADLSINFD